MVRNRTSTSWFDVRKLLSLLVLTVVGYPSMASTPTYSDVPFDHWATTFIKTFGAYGYTAGCGGGKYCPGQSVTRAQMAVFLVRAFHGVDYRPPPARGNAFLDVAASDFAASYIEQLYLDGITAGCGGNNFCPDDRVTRAQMAVFLLRVKHGPAYVPPAAEGIFNDVPFGHWAMPWIEQLAREEITLGCGNGNYCPDVPVTRDQMAVFMSRAFIFLSRKVETWGVNFDGSVSGTPGSGIFEWRWSDGISRDNLMLSFTWDFGGQLTGGFRVSTKCDQLSTGELNCYPSIPGGEHQLLEILTGLKVHWRSPPPEYVVRNITMDFGENWFDGTFPNGGRVLFSSGSVDVDHQSYATPATYHMQHDGQVYSGNVWAYRIP